MLALAALTLGACGGDDGDGVAADPTPVADAAETATTSPPAESAPTESEPDAGTATIPPPLELAGTSWIVTNYYSPTDQATTNPLEDDTVVVFAEDGTLSGHNGCNDFAGTWEITGPYYDYDEGQEAFEDKQDGQPLSIAAERTTDIECDGFLADQDADVMASLTGTEIWFIGNTLGDQEGGIMLDGEDARVYLDPA